ncbi:hypothetical protein DDE18_05815 [Nocardioides gansuensis]|uniref:Spore coat protein CotH n=2 Tax=Nocardioides gansuensis TaxID=2138300 RepID=A0A2T8FDN2_9ACTN|nr:hypothetical protein DDE18_05815 [Nocardioides gansuensis]
MVLRRHGRAVFRGRIGIELRGESSRRFPKKAYGVELRDRSGDNRDAGLLGMPADDDWALYPSYNDKTLVRNTLAYATARRLGRYASRTRHVELWLNGRYRGVYVLIEKLKLHDDRVDLEEPAHLLEWISWQETQDEGVDVRLPGADVPLVFDDPERGDLDREERQEVRRSVKAADAALYGPAFTDPATGWRGHLDEAAAVDYVLLNELFKNQDGFHKSVYLARGAAGRWVLGPIWDFDLSMGNSRFAPASPVAGSTLADRGWAERLYADPTFVAALAARWRALRAAGLRPWLHAEVKRSTRQLVRSGAARRNFQRWPVLGKVVWPNPAEAADRTTYASEVRALRTWLDARVAWLDEHVHELRPRS